MTENPGILSSVTDWLKVLVVFSYSRDKTIDQANLKVYHASRWCTNTFYVCKCRKGVGAWIPPLNDWNLTPCGLTPCGLLPISPNPSWFESWHKESFTKTEKQIGSWTIYYYICLHMLTIMFSIYNYIYMLFREQNSLHPTTRRRCSCRFTSSAHPRRVRPSGEE